MSVLSQNSTEMSTLVYKCKWTKIIWKMFNPSFFGTSIIIKNYDNFGFVLKYGLTPKQRVQNYEKIYIFSKKSLKPYGLR